MGLFKALKRQLLILNGKMILPAPSFIVIRWTIGQK